MPGGSWLDCCAYVRKAEPSDSRRVASVPYWDRPSCCWGTLKLERAFEPGSLVSLVALVSQGDQRAHGTIQHPSDEQPLLGRAIAQSRTRPRYRGQGHGGLVAPILVLPMRRDARYERPHALCERLLIKRLVYKTKKLILKYSLDYS